jgi:hypothetical protein
MESLTADDDALVPDEEIEGPRLRTELGTGPLVVRGQLVTEVGRRGPRDRKRHRARLVDSTRSQVDGSRISSSQIADSSCPASTRSPNTGQISRASSSAKSPDQPAPSETRYRRRERACISRYVRPWRHSHDRYRDRRTRRLDRADARTLRYYESWAANAYRSLGASPALRCLTNYSRRCRTGETRDLDVGASGLPGWQLVQDGAAYAYARSPKPEPELLRLSGARQSADHHSRRATQPRAAI